MNPMVDNFTEQLPENAEIRLSGYHFCSDRLKMAFSMAFVQQASVAADVWIFSGPRRQERGISAATET